MRICVPQIRMPSAALFSTEHMRDTRTLFLNLPCLPYRKCPLLETANKDNILDANTKRNLHRQFQLFGQLFRVQHNQKKL